MKLLLKDIIFKDLNQLKLCDNFLYLGYNCRFTEMYACSHINVAAEIATEFEGSLFSDL